MSMEAFNQLLGLSTIDARVRSAYEQGTWDSLLDEFGFDLELRKELSRLKANTYEEYLHAAFLLIRQADSSLEMPIPKPTFGLRREGDPEGAKRVA
jgi:hypothetical protein